MARDLVLWYYLRGFLGDRQPIVVKLLSLLSFYVWCDMNKYLSMVLRVLVFTSIYLLVSNYFFSGSEQNNQHQVAGQVFVAPVNEIEAKPLNREVAFDERQTKAEPELVTITTNNCEYVFSTRGAILNEIKFLKHVGPDGQPLETIVPKIDFENREEGAFLIAFDEKTPLVYKNTANKHEDGRFTIEFVGSNDLVSVTKSYHVFDHNYRLDLQVTFRPKKHMNKGIIPRIFVPGPFVSQVPDDVVSGMILGVNKKTIKTIDVDSSEEKNSGWLVPLLMGAQDKYFTHAFIGSEKNFIRRGFYKRSDKAELVTILEGCEISKEADVTLSFYLGPKIYQQMMAVDARLIDSLHGGWFPYIGRILFWLLDWLYSLVKNYGLAIILLTLLIRIPLMPFMIKSSQRSAELAKFEAKYKPTIDAINLKYKGDSARQMEETGKLYEQHNISRGSTILFGFLSAAITLPIMISLLWMINNNVMLYQASFIGWIKDLSSGDPYYFLPLLASASMLYVQRALFGDKMQATALIMPIIAIAFFVRLPAGLVLYFFIGNLVSIMEARIKKMYYA